jgi:hypothetical protein
MNLARLRQFLVKPPLVAIPAKLINGRLMLGTLWGLMAVSRAALARATARA